MNEVLKQRLVGALILVALGVVFWPIIFVQPGTTASEEPRSIPVQPGVNTTPLSAPDQVGLRGSKEFPAAQERLFEPAAPVAPVISPTTESASAESPAPVAAKKTAAPAQEKRTRSEAPQALALDSDGVPIAWILQIVSVSSEAKAEELRNELLAMNQKAYVRKVSRNGKMLYRIYIGPKFERAKLEKLKPGIDSEFGVTSMVVRYVP